MLKQKVEETMLFFVILTALAQGQTLNVGDTGGKGKTGVFVAGNGMAIKGFTVGGYSLAYLSYGLTNRVDLYAGATATTLLGQTQIAASVGTNARLVTAKGVSISSYLLLATPLHRRQEACGLTVFEAVIASRKFTGKEKLIPYIGYSATVPLGERKEKIFTPPSMVHNVPVGMMFPIGKALLFTEFNYGRTTKTFGIGVAYAF